MYLEHVARHQVVKAERTVTYYLAMKSADPHTLVAFSRYCGFDHRDRTKPSQLAADLHKEPGVGTLVRITMVKVLEHEPRLQNGGEFNADTGELIPHAKKKKGLSGKTVVIIIVSAVMGTVASVAVGLMVYFRMQAESAARYSPFTWMAERRRRSSAASSYQDRDSYCSADEGGAYEGRGAPSFSLSPPDGLERPARGGGAAAGAGDDAGGYDSLEESDDGDASTYDEERSDDGRGGEGGGATPATGGGTALAGRGWSATSRCRRRRFATPTRGPCRICRQSRTGRCRGGGGRWCVVFVMVHAAFGRFHCVRRVLLSHSCPCCFSAQADVRKRRPCFVLRLLFQRRLPINSGLLVASFCKGGL
ncbi:hypothetical protein BU14_0022s0044, partial [Porphyra umbilicalis]